MSLHLFSDDVIFLQRFLKCGGLYGGKVDGIWGRRTDAAAAAFDEGSQAIAERHDEPHYQLATASRIAAVRSSFETGVAYV